MMADPSRRTNHSNANAPRYLLSGIALCGICGDGTRAKVNGGGYCCGSGKGQLAVRAGEEAAGLLGVRAVGGRAARHVHPLL
jgi:hypothetical protein